MREKSFSCLLTPHLEVTSFSARASERVVFNSEAALKQLLLGAHSLDRFLEAAASACQLGDFFLDDSTSALSSSRRCARLLLVLRSRSRDFSVSWSRAWSFSISAPVGLRSFPQCLVLDVELLEIRPKIFRFPQVRHRPSSDGGKITDGFVLFFLGIFSTSLTGFRKSCSRYRQGARIQKSLRKAAEYAPLGRKASGRRRIRGQSRFPLRSRARVGWSREGRAVLPSDVDGEINRVKRKT